MSKLPRAALVMMAKFTVDPETGKVFYQAGLCRDCGMIHRTPEGAVFCAEYRKQ